MILFLHSNITKGATMASITKRGKVWQARYSKRVKKLVK